MMKGIISMNFLANLDEGHYEVLVATLNSDNTFHIKPFGVKYEANHFILNLFPNRTLLNIKRSKMLKLYFCNDSLLFTRALFSNISEEELSNNKLLVISCEVISINLNETQDTYGQNITTKITLKADKILENNTTIPIINRATNHIIELLVDSSRYNMMNIDSKKKFHKKLETSEKLIEKIGNKDHKKAIKIIKKETREL